jgi:hypothetical protein
MIGPAPLWQYMDNEGNLLPYATPFVQLATCLCFRAITFESEMENKLFDDERESRTTKTCRELSSGSTTVLRRLRNFKVNRRSLEGYPRRNKINAPMCLVSSCAPQELTRTLQNLDFTIFKGYM